MSPAHVIEPTYLAIKQRLQSGDLAPGTRLESTKLAYDHNVSITPVRDCLHRLAGEQMVDFAHGEGFRAHLISEAELRDMLGLNLVLLQASLADQQYEVPNTRSAREYPERLAALCLGIARRSHNHELVTAVARLSDRLNIVRRLDTSLLGDVDAELDQIEGALTGPDAELRDLLVRHHERRSIAAGSYVRCLAGH